MQELQTKPELREAILNASKIMFDGEWVKTQSQAGFLKMPEHKFIFVNDMYKHIKKHKVKKEGEKLIVL